MAERDQRRGSAVAGGERGGSGKGGPRRRGSVSSNAGGEGGGMERERAEGERHRRWGKWEDGEGAVEGKRRRRWGEAGRDGERRGK